MRFIPHFVGQFFIIIAFIIFFSSASHAMGNYPQAKDCPDDKPYYSFCSNSLHSLEGWHGQCRATREEAQKDATLHAQQEHDGNDRYTGVLKSRGEY
jgi:hypothetical protein